MKWFKYCPHCLGNDFFKIPDGITIKCSGCDWIVEYFDMLDKEEVLCIKRTKLIEKMLK